MILGIQKQPAADTVTLTRAIEKALAELKESLPAGMAAPRVTFRQASFIEASIGNLQASWSAASVFVAIVLFVFLLHLRHHRDLADRDPGVDLRSPRWCSATSACRSTR